MRQHTANSAFHPPHVATSVRTLVGYLRAVVRSAGRFVSRHRHPAVSFALAALVFGVVFHQFITKQTGHSINDFGSHLDYAASIRSAGDIRSPHFLFQVLVIAIDKVPGFGWTGSTVALLAVTYGGMAALLFGELRRRAPLAPAYRLQALVIALLLASHVFLATMYRHNLYWGYFVPVMYTNPTQQLNKLFALWIYFWYSTGIMERERPRLGQAPALAALCVLSALAKPSFLIAFLPASGLNGLGDLLRSRWRHLAVFVAGIALPSLAVLLWQTRMANAGTGMAVLFAPFAVFNAAETAYKLPLSLAFPIAVLYVAFRTESNRRRLYFSWLFTTIALFYTLGLAEADANLLAGNFAWTGQTAVFLAYIESALFLLTVPAGSPGRRFAWGVLAVHVACGVFWYGSVFLPDQDTWL